MVIDEEATEVRGGVPPHTHTHTHRVLSTGMDPLYRG